MKKIIIYFFSICLLLVACKSSKNEEKKTEIESDTTNSKIVATVYQCPMDCENGKTYADTGKCPVCEMDLEKK